MNLREARLKKGYTHREIADLLNISRSAYTKYETEVNNLDAKTIIKLSQILEVSTDYLLDVNIYDYPGNDPSIRKIINIAIKLSNSNRGKLLDYAEMLEIVENATKYED